MLCIHYTFIPYIILYQSCCLVIICHLFFIAVHVSYLFQQVVTTQQLLNALNIKYEILRGGGRPSFRLKEEAKKPNGNAPMPNDIWKPLSPRPNPFRFYK